MSGYKQIEMSLVFVVPWEGRSPRSLTKSWQEFGYLRDSVSNDTFGSTGWANRDADRVQEKEGQLQLALPSYFYGEDKWPIDLKLPRKI